MKTHAITIRPLSSFITPWQADTMFGHLCWEVAYSEGEAALKKFLEPFVEGEPPFILSDGFPDNLLPLPLSATIAATGRAEAPTRESFDRAKKLKATELVPLESFNRALRLEPFELPERTAEPVVSAEIVHNTINRLTSTTPEDGGVYARSESFAGSGIDAITFYVKVADGSPIDEVRDLFERTARRGYGKRATVGKGTIELVSVNLFDGFSEPEDADGFVSLSNFVPAEADPTTGFYRTMVKYGKLGGALAHSGNPFKKPLLMLKAGSCFLTGSKPRQFYGRIVRGLAPIHPDIVQYGYAFAVGLKMPENSWG